MMCAWAKASSPVPSKKKEVFLKKNNSRSIQLIHSYSFCLHWQLAGLLTHCCLPSAAEMLVPSGLGLTQSFISMCFLVQIVPNSFPRANSKGKKKKRNKKGFVLCEKSRGCTLKQSLEEERETWSTASHYRVRSPAWTLDSELWPLTSSILTSLSPAWGGTVDTGVKSCFPQGKPGGRTQQEKGRVNRPETELIITELTCHTVRLSEISDDAPGVWKTLKYNCSSFSICRKERWVLAYLWLTCSQARLEFIHFEASDGQGVMVTDSALVCGVEYMDLNSLLQDRKSTAWAIWGETTILQVEMEAYDNAKFLFSSSLQICPASSRLSLQHGSEEDDQLCGHFMSLLLVEFWPTFWKANCQINCATRSSSPQEKNAGDKQASATISLWLHAFPLLSVS